MMPTGLTDYLFGTNKKRRQGKALRRAPRRSSFSFETLEARQMLAADMAEIIGIVRSDLQGDGNASNDVVVAGAVATLYRDGGNGVFDGGSGDDVQLAQATTNSQGKYHFNGLEAGTYFVKVTLPPELQFQPGNDVQKVMITLADAEGSLGPVIDDFESTQVVEVTPPLPASQPSHLIDSNVMGGERDMYVELTQGTDPFSSVSLISAMGLLRLSSGTMVTGNAQIVWDGIDGDAEGINYTGLGGLDFTEFNGNTMTGISLTSGADHPNAQIKLRVYSDANNWSEFTTTVPQVPGGQATGEAIFRFADAPTATGGSGADFANVGALELIFEGVKALDGQVSVIGLVGRTTKRVDFTAAPRMSLGDQVWADINDNGIFDPGEKGIAGVKLNVYQDTDKNGKFTPGVDEFVGTTTTDASGKYLFTDLFPGNYVVQVDPTNFAPGGALEGLVSSLNDEPAPDPNLNIDNLDKGAAMTGAGVVSRAISLVGGQEPTNGNTNLTMDFGFFGFDLVLDKSVQQMSVAPNEQLTYNIKINNDGPSEAANTTFKDTLPPNVTYVSGTVSIPGVTLQHNNGIVTANLGTVAPGAEIFITLIATVGVDAAGTLVNTATVAAPKEINLSNNTDSVSNVVTPRIDLAITKVDSRDPVEPGSTFTYTIEIINNGPSHATGVIVTDNLPAEVTYVTSSQTPSSINGRELAFDIGNLARGATRTITIDVRVDDTFVGELINYAHVQGNEQETNLKNNDAMETTQVKFKPGSIGGSVFVDKNDNGVFDPGEKPIAGVIITLRGTDFAGTSVVQTTTTAADGSYLFDNLNPGNYHLVQTQPQGYLDGKNHIGTLGGVHGLEPGQMLLPQGIQDHQIQDLIFNINLQSGQVGEKYDFGEQSISISKRSFLAR